MKVFDPNMLDSKIAQYSSFAVTKDLYKKSIIQCNNIAKVIDMAAPSLKCFQNVNLPNATSKLSLALCLPHHCNPSDLDVSIANITLVDTFCQTRETGSEVDAGDKAVT